LLRYVAWAYGRFNERGQLPRSLLDPAMKFEQAASIIDTAGTFYGIAGFEAMLGELRGAFGKIRFDPESVIELSPDDLLLTIHFRALGGGSGVTATRVLAHRLTLAAGNIVRFQVFWEADEALEAAGLTEQPLWTKVGSARPPAAAGVYETELLFKRAARRPGQRSHSAREAEAGDSHSPLVVPEVAT
jgi:hypothetical protein